MTTPTLETIQLEASKIGLPDVEAEKFFCYYSSNGWRVGRNPMKSWPHALRHWKLNWQPKQNGGGFAGAKPMSVLDLRNIIAVKQAQMEELKRRHSYPDAFGDQWDSTTARETCRLLRIEVKTLNERISKMA